MASRSDDLSFPVRSPDPVSGVSEILFVCQANRCRSPFAAAIAERLAGESLRIHSGGLLPGGSSMPSTGIDVGRMLGIDFRGHRSRELDRGELGGFDLILTMAKDQARELVADDPRLQSRVFTLKQFARWIAHHRRPEGEALGAWLDREVGRRAADDFVGADPGDDVADPIRSPSSEWIAMARELTDLISAVVRDLEPTDPEPRRAVGAEPVHPRPGSRAALRRARTDAQAESGA